jgi:RNA polymerase sigma factor (sigma-70 family)
VETTQTNLLWAVRDTQNKDAWVSFHRLYSTMVSHFVRRLGVADADVDDVTQEVLMLAHKSLQTGRYEPSKGRFRNWLYGIARKRALATLRAGRRPTRLQSVQDEHGVDLVDRIEDKRDEDAAMELWQQEWRYALLDEALRQVQVGIGKTAFDAFVLHAIERKPVEAVASQLKIAPSSVYVYKRRVLTAVRQWIMQFEGE